jgi:hypothetical protein
LSTILLLKTEPDFLARDQPVELTGVRGPYLETPLFHDDPTLGAIYRSDLADDFLWRQNNASSPGPHGRGVGTRSHDEKYKNRDLPDHAGILQFGSIYLLSAP